MKAFVLDSDVLVAGFRSDRGASRLLMKMALDRKFELILSVPLLLEYEAVLTRPENLEASGASQEDVEAVLDEFALIARRVDIVIRTRPALPDVDDEMVFETAINGVADGIVTFNRRDFKIASSGFSCPVYLPSDVVRELRAEG